MWDILVSLSQVTPNPMLSHDVWCFYSFSCFTSNLKVLVVASSIDQVTQAWTGTAQHLRLLETSKEMGARDTES